jgi:hypothetical protein
MKTEKTETADLDVVRLLSLKTYERPDPGRSEKNIQNIMRTVRSTSNRPTLLLFPDKGMAWAFAQPRYGIAALFVLFLGLHLLDRPMPTAPVGAFAIQAPEPASALTGVTIETNRAPSINIPGMIPQSYYSSSFAGAPKPVLTSYGE